MTPPIPESWERVERWLAAHAPATHSALLPPATPDEVVAAERAIGMAFPEPLVESLQRHNGTDRGSLPGLLPPFWSLLGTEEMAETWRMRTRIYEESTPEHERAEEEAESEAALGPWWHRQWIPFAEDGGGDELVLDQRPTAPLPGRIGRADHEQGCRFLPHPMWESLPALFAATATALETGEAVGSYEPFVTADGELDWDIP
ncbi:SMI1/KNR4 family protein [Streptomyces sp. ODS28]|uniref:SMI1/KNR4 family protein n=1 Tax=Streptomyces sp. ODS28 TaxID=3136688 RepID=UPI0031EA6C96